MKVAFINGSPKREKSASRTILLALQERLGAPAGSHIFHISALGGEEAPDFLAGCDAIIFAFPLYVDGIPAYLLRFLEEIKNDIASIAPKARVYAIVNNGFYEGEQNALALQMMENFCLSSGLQWGQGLGVGAGGMVQAAPVGSGPMKNLGQALDGMAENILRLQAAETRFVAPNFPRFLYKAGAHLGWRAQARKNGLKAKDILARGV